MTRAGHAISLTCAGSATAWPGLARRLDPGDPAIKPKLRVDMNLAGRLGAQVIGNDWIMNDGGENDHRSQPNGSA